MPARTVGLERDLLQNVGVLVLRPVLVLLIAGQCACAKPVAGPFYGDDKLLRFGVDPHAEAEEVRVAFERSGQSMRERLAGQHFTAMAFQDASGEPTAVRVVTARGIVVALDSRRADSLRPALRVDLLPRPLPDSHDADGDGFEEVFIEQRTGARLCVLVYRIRDVGFADPLSIGLAWLGDDPCVEHVADRDGDGKVELLTTWTLTDVPLSIQPSIEVAFFPDHHHYEPVAPPHYYAGAITTADVELADAQGGSPERVYELGLRLAALHWLSGADTDAQLAQLDRAFALISPGARDDALEQALRARIQAGLP